MLHSLYKNIDCLCLKNPIYFYVTILFLFYIKINIINYKIYS